MDEMDTMDERNQTPLISGLLPLLTPYQRRHRGGAFSVGPIAKGLPAFGFRAPGLQPSRQNLRQVFRRHTFQSQFVHPPADKIAAGVEVVLSGSATDDTD